MVSYFLASDENHEFYSFAVCSLPPPQHESFNIVYKEAIETTFLAELLQIICDKMTQPQDVCVATRNPIKGHKNVSLEIFHYHN